MCLKKPDGKLVIDLYGDAQPLRLELKLDIYELMKKKRIVLQVENLSGSQLITEAESEAQ